MIAAALQAQSAYLASVGWGHVGNDTTHDDILDRLTVGAGHSRYLLTEQPASLIHLGFIAAVLAAIYSFPRHDSYFWLTTALNDEPKMTYCVLPAMVPSF